MSVLPKLTVVSSVGFSGIKELHWTWTCRSIHFWLSPGWDASPSQVYPQDINLLVPIHMYRPLWVEKDTVIARTQCNDWQRLNLLNQESSPLTFWHKTPCLNYSFYISRAFINLGSRGLISWSTRLTQIQMPKGQASRLESPGGMLPRKFWNWQALKYYFTHSLGEKLILKKV